MEHFMDISGIVRRKNQVMDGFMEEGFMDVSENDKVAKLGVFWHARKHFLL
jgi:hypothetical protein